MTVFLTVFTIFLFISGRLSAFFVLSALFWPFLKNAPKTSRKAQLSENKHKNAAKKAINTPKRTPQNDPNLCIYIIP